jgi:hypothetical protein
MNKSKKNTIAVFAIAAFLVAAVVFVAPAVNNMNREIPFGQEFGGIEDLAQRLDVPTKIFEAYLAAIDVNYDDFTDHLNTAQMTPEEFAEYMQLTTGYAYSDYIQVLTLLSNAEPPDEEFYDKITAGETANVDVFISRSSRGNLSENGIAMHPTPSDDEQATRLFHLYLLLQRGNIPLFITGANDVFGCESVELTNINIYANYGVAKPDNDNEMVSSMFSIREGTNEIFNPTAMPVMTLRFDDSSRDFAVGVISSAGIMFIADSVEPLKMMNDVDFFDVHFRQQQIPELMSEREGLNP